MAKGKRKAAGSAQTVATAPSGNEVEARALARMVKRAEGFVLGIAVANASSLRRTMVEEIRRLCPEKKISELELDQPISSLLSAIEEAFGFGRGLDTLFVYGLEYSISGDEGYVPIFGNLNLTRNLFPQKCPYPIVLWLPQYAVGRLSQYAPDFFSWRSGTYTFSLEAEDFRTYVADQLRDRGKFEELTGVEKEDRILALEEILRRLRDLPEDSRVLHERIYALDALGALYFFMGRYERSAACYREALEMSRILGNREGESSSLHQLGIIAEEQGDLQQAERLYRESLVIVRALGDRAREAATLHNLGVIAQERGDLSEAERLYRKNLAIRQMLGDLQGQAMTLHQLGRVAQERGDLSEAERLYRESLTITQALGNRPRAAATLHQLGTVAQKRGDLAEAERLYRESLTITQALGNRPREAATLHQLGRIAQERGDLAEAERLYRESLTIAQALGDRGGEANSLHNLGVIAEERGDLAEAERLYRESLMIKRSMGNRAGEAASLHQLGVIAEERGDLAEAERLYRESLAIAEQIGLKDAEIPRRSLERIRSQGLTQQRQQT